MNTLLRHTLQAFALMAAPVAAAPVVTVEGFVGLGGEPVSGVFTATVEAVTGGGDVLLASSVPSFELVDGRFAFALDLAGAAGAIENGDTVTVNVDLGDGLEGAVHLGPVFAAGHAGRADRAVTALSVDALGDIPAADLVPDAPLAVPVAFANLSSLPPGIDDGVDNGTVDTLTGLALTGGVLDVAAGGVTDIVAGSVTATHLADGSVTSVQLGALAVDRVANGSLTGANFANDAVAGTADVKGTRSVSKRPAGCDRPFELAVGNACSRRACTISGQNCTTNVCRVACGGGCENLGPSPSGISLFCFYGTNDFRGRLIADP